MSIQALRPPAREQTERGLLTSRLRLSKTILSRTPIRKMRSWSSYLECCNFLIGSLWSGFRMLDKKRERYPSTCRWWHMGLRTIILSLWVMLQLAWKFVSETLEICWMKFYFVMLKCAGQINIRIIFVVAVASVAFNIAREYDWRQRLNCAFYDTGVRK